MPPPDATPAAARDEAPGAHDAGTNSRDAAPREPPFVSLSRSLVTASLAVGLIISLLATLAFVYRDYRDEVALARGRLDEIGRAFVPSLARGLRLGHEAEVDALLDGLAQLEGVEFVALEAPGRARRERGHADAEVMLERRFMLRPDGEPGLELGDLRVVVGPGDTEARLKRRSVAIAVITVLALLGASLWQYLGFRRRVTRHLEQLAAHARAFDLAHPDRPLHLHRGERRTRDELDDVGDALNRLRERMIESVATRARYDAELAQHREHLEALVHARTAELESKARQLAAAHEAESQARAAALRSAARFADFAEVAADGFWETDAELRLTHLSPSFAHAMGLEVEQVIGKTPDEAWRLRFPGVEDLSTFTAPLHARLAFAQQWLPTQDARGERHWLLNQGRPYHDASGAFAGYRGAVRDVTREWHAERAYKASEERLRLITDAMPALIARIDRDRRFSFNNRAYEKWLQRPLERITGRSLREVHGDGLYERLAPQLDRAFAGETRTFEIDEAGYHIRVTFVPEADALGIVTAVHSLAHDITQLKRIEHELRMLAQYDTLTGLANRRRFNERLVEAIARSERSGRGMALLFLDLDRFKQVNDSHGHEAGDLVLKEFGARLGASVRRTDTVARLAGDEFVIILEPVKDAAEAELVAGKILAAMQPPLRRSGLELRLSTSIGVVLREPGETDPEALLRRADAALYAAKSTRRGSFHVAPAP